MTLTRSLGELVRGVVYSNVWIGLGAAAQTWFTFQLVDATVDEHLVLWAGLGTIAVYAWQRLVKIGGIAPRVTSDRHRWIADNERFLWVLSAVCLVGAFTAMINLPSKHIWAIFLLSPIAFFYTLPWHFGGSSRRSLRELPYLKIFLIAVCWTGVTAFLPLMLRPDISILHGAILLANFLFVLSITIPFDIRDLATDESGKRTLPQVLGVRKAVTLALVIWLGASVLLQLVISMHHGTMVNLIVLAGQLFTGLLILRSEEDRPELYFTGLLDGTLILVPGMYFLASAFGH